MARERGLICCSEMVKAFLKGRKTQFRQVIDLPAGVEWTYTGKMDDGSYRFEHPGLGGVIDGCCFRKPRYRVGDELYLKEGFRCTGGGDWKGLLYRADGEDTVRSYLGIDDGRVRKLPESLWLKWDHYVYATNISCGWRPASTMPKDFARLWREVVAVKDPHRIQDISPEDCEEEGITGKTLPSPVRGQPYEEYRNGDGLVYSTPKDAFQALWDSLHGPDSWENNDWVFPYELETVEEPK